MMWLIALSVWSLLQGVYYYTIQGGLAKENGFHYQQFWSKLRIKGHGQKKGKKMCSFLAIGGASVLRVKGR